MTTKKQGALTAHEDNRGEAKHLRPFWKRKFWKRERKAVEVALREVRVNK